MRPALRAIRWSTPVDEAEHRRGQRGIQGAAAYGAAPSILRALAARQGFAAFGRPPRHQGLAALARGGP